MWRPVLAGVLALGLAGIAGGNGTTPTEANWADAEVATGQFTALTVPPPTATRACEYRSILGLGGRVYLYWTPPAGYEVSDMVIKASSNGLGTLLAPITGFSLSGNTTVVSGRNYKTTMSANLLGGLLGLNTALEVAIVTKDGTWESVPLSFETNAGVALGLGQYCKNL